MSRYRVGFENPSITCPFLERNKGYAPIVDTSTPFAFGAVIALVDGKDMADRITRLLNKDSDDGQR